MGNLSNTAGSLSNNCTSVCNNICATKWSFCARCGAKLEQGFNYCPSCGGSIGLLGAPQLNPYVAPYYPYTNPFIGPNTCPTYYCGDPLGGILTGGAQTPFTNGTQQALGAQQANLGQNTGTQNCN